MADTYDLIVLGSGPGGYVAAIRAAQLGLKTAIVERENLGGICLNWGCIPTKALLRSAEVFHNMKHADAYGLTAGAPGFDLAKVVARSRGVAKQLNQGVTHLMKKNKIAVHMGDGALTGAGQADRHQGRQGDRACRQAHHRRHRRPRPRPAVRQGRRRAHLDLSPRDGAQGDADRIAGHRLGRDRDRVRQFLQRPRRQGDGGRNARPHRAGRGCRRVRRAGQVARQAGHDDPDRGRGREPQGRRQGRRGEDQDQGRQDRRTALSATASSRSGSCPTPRISGSKSSA